MNKHVFTVAVVALGLLGAGCGGTSYKEQFTCLRSDGLCLMLKTNDTSFAGQTRDACTQGGGQLTLDPCSHSGLLGKCTTTDNDSEADYYIYASDVVTTKEGAQAACANLQGSFSDG
jgi:hypothetical protein